MEENVRSVEYINMIMSIGVKTSLCVANAIGFYMVNYRLHQKCSQCEKRFLNKKDMREHKYEDHAN